MYVVVRLFRSDSCSFILDKVVNRPSSTSFPFEILADNTATESVICVQTWRLVSGPARCSVIVVKRNPRVPNNV